MYLLLLQQLLLCIMRTELLWQHRGNTCLIQAALLLRLLLKRLLEKHDYEGNDGECRATSYIHIYFKRYLAQSRYLSSSVRQSNSDLLDVKL